MPKTITIELPEEIHALIESDPFLKLLVERIIKENIINYILSILAMDKLIEDSKLTEEDIMKVDEEIKRGIRRRLNMKLIVDTNKTICINRDEELITKISLISYIK
jgi:hypothetical protein